MRHIPLSGASVAPQKRGEIMFKTSTTAIRAGLASAAVLLLFGLPAHARPDTRTMTCAQAQDLVKRSGAIVLSTGQYTYSRFVADRRYCGHYEILRPSYAPTRDTAQCPVAYYCERVVRPRN